MGDRVRTSKAGSEAAFLQRTRATGAVAPATADEGAMGLIGTEDCQARLSAARRALLDAGPQPGAGRNRLRRLRAVVLLDGTVWRASSSFAESVGRSLLELPVSATQCLLDLWRDQFLSLCDVLRSDELRCRIVVGRTTRPPALRRLDEAAGLSVELDPSDLRGTGGVLRDLAEEYDDDDAILVANAAQLLAEPLCRLAVDAAERGGDVTVVANEDGTPTSIALLSCRALRHLPSVGFVDLKEQGLPLMAARHEVTILRRAAACGLPIRTPADYLAAVRAHQRMSAGEFPRQQPFDERWGRRFALVEPGAMVAADATLHDAVVLRGARVEPGALVANAVVCRGATIGRGESVQGQLLTRRKRSAISAEAVAR